MLTEKGREKCAENSQNKISQLEVYVCTSRMGIELLNMKHQRGGVSPKKYHAKPIKLQLNY